MERLWLRVRAPFAAFRALQAGVYRPTAPTMPPSAALGLILNCAGIEMRAPEGSAVTLIRPDVPRMQLAIGDVQTAEVSTLYQQLHSYPVGGSGKERRAGAHGAKYWIAPARRELLVNLDVMLGVHAEADLLERAHRGLRGELDAPRYGLPFAGDNNFLFDRLDVLRAPLPARWYTPVRSGEPARRGSCRLTVGIDRKDSSKTHSALLAPLEEACEYPPEDAWIWTPRSPERM